MRFRELRKDAADAILRASDDPVKTDLELRCLECDEHLCDAEDGDVLSSLFGVVKDHVCEVKSKRGSHAISPKDGRCQTCGRKRRSRRFCTVCGEWLDYIARKERA